MMLTINDLIAKLMWESADDILDLLEIDTLDMLEALEDIVIDHQDKLREYYEDTETLDGKEVTNESD
jgi:hypothetical protein